jgi:hypothetical protein
MMPVPGIEPGLSTMSLLKYSKTNFTHWIQTLAARIRVEDFVTRPSELDNNELHKAVLGKIPVWGTNLDSSEWN